MASDEGVVMDEARFTAIRSVLVFDGERRVARALVQLLKASDPSISVEVVGLTDQVSDEQLHGHELVVFVLRSGELDGGLRAVSELTSRAAPPVVVLSSRDGIRAAVLAHGAAAFIHYGNAPGDVLRMIGQATAREGKNQLVEPGA